MKKLIAVLRAPNKNLLFDLFLAITFLGIIAAAGLPPMFSVRY